MKPAIKTAFKWAALAFGGFVLGAGAAWLQRSHTIQGAPTEIQAPAVTKDGMLVRPSDIGKDAASPSENVAAAPSETAPSGAESGLGKLSGEATDLTAPDKNLTRIDQARKEDDKHRNGEEPAPPSMQPLVSGVKSSFSLTDHSGAAVTEQSWPGKYLLVFFGFTHCPDICPVTLDKMTSVLNKLGDAAASVQPLFISVDPARDTPDVLKEYVSHFHKSILGLTGTDAQVKAAEDAFKVYAAKINGTAPGQDYTFDHSAYVYLMEPGGGMAEIIKVQDRASDIVDKIKPHLDGTKQPETQP